MINLVKIVRIGDYVLNIHDDLFVPVGLLGRIASIRRRSDHIPLNVVVDWENDTRSLVRFQHVKHLGLNRPAAIL